MLSRPHKFPLRASLLTFRRRAKRLVTPHTTIYYLQSANSSRLAVVVPAKVNKLAVARNSFKRHIYNLVWPLIASKNLDCVIIFKPISLPKGKASLTLLKYELSQTTLLQ